MQQQVLGSVAMSRFCQFSKESKFTWREIS